MGFEDYFKEVLHWNDELKNFLQSENVDRSEEIWKRLDQMTEIIEGIKNPETMSNEELIDLQYQVENLHEDMENYFRRRQNTGAMFQSAPFIEAGRHTLPTLPYAYHALEPYIAGEIMRLHHTKHHQSYVDGLNKAEKELERARKTDDYSLVKHWSRELAFHGSGHYLHTIFWNNMSPAGGGQPAGKLAQEINKYFGSFSAFKKHFSEAAKAVEGVGWALLVWSPRARRLEILQTEKHHVLTQWDTIPLLVLDVWEHAYYLQYKNNRGEYVDNWWNIVNWQNVSERFRQAERLQWRPF